MFSICRCCSCTSDSLRRYTSQHRPKQSFKCNGAKQSTLFKCFRATQFIRVTISLQRIHPDNENDVTDDDLCMNTSCRTPRTVDVHSWLTLQDISPAALASLFESSARSRKVCPCHINRSDGGVRVGSSSSAASQECDLPRDTQAQPVLATLKLK